jgi:hypothetical protein
MKPCVDPLEALLPYFTAAVLVTDAYVGLRHSRKEERNAERWSKKRISKAKCLPTEIPTKRSPLMILTKILCENLVRPTSAPPSIRLLNARGWPIQIGSTTSFWSCSFVILNCDGNKILSPLFVTWEKFFTGKGLELSLRTGFQAFPVLQSDDKNEVRLDSW